MMTSGPYTGFLPFYHFLMLLSGKRLPLLQEAVPACKQQVWLSWTEQVDVESRGICPWWSDGHALIGFLYLDRYLCKVPRTGLMDGPAAVGRHNFLSFSSSPGQTIYCSAFN